MYCEAAFSTDGCIPHYKCVHLCVLFIRYMKGKDAANWITVDSVTGEILLAKNLDYESLHVVNGTYTITMLGVTTGKLRGWFRLVCLPIYKGSWFNLPTSKVRQQVQSRYSKDRHRQLIF